VRILHVPHAYLPTFGGAEKHCAELSSALASMGHDVTVLTGNAWSYKSYEGEPIPVRAPKNELLNRVRVKRVPIFSTSSLASYKLIHRMLPRCLAYRIWRPFLSAQRDRLTAAITHEIQTEKPDVVMTMPHNLTNVQCVINLAARMPFPLVFVPLLHPTWDTSTKLWFRRAFAVANSLVANTSAEAETLIAEYNVPKEKVFVGWLGANVQPLPSKPRRNQVLCLGRVVQSKNIPFLVQAMLRVWEVLPDVTLVIAGAYNDETPDVRSATEKLAGDHIGKIQFRFDLSAETKDQLFGESGCLVLPSFNESFGIVLLEAMAFGTPVITLNIPVFRSFITSGQNGILVSAAASDEMAAAILKLLENQHWAQEIGKAGRKLIEEKFTWQSVGNRYLEAYSYAIVDHKLR